MMQQTITNPFTLALEYLWDGENEDKGEKVSTLKEAVSKACSLNPQVGLNKSIKAMFMLCDYVGATKRNDFQWLCQTCTAARDWAAIAVGTPEFHPNVQEWRRRWMKRLEADWEDIYRETNRKN